MTHGMTRGMGELLLAKQGSLYTTRIQRNTTKVQGRRMDDADKGPATWRLCIHEGKMIGWSRACGVVQAEECVVRQVQAEKDVLVAELRAHMASMQRQHDAIAAELQQKLAW